MLTIVLVIESDVFSPIVYEIMRNVIRKTEHLI